MHTKPLLKRRVTSRNSNKSKVCCFQLRTLPPSAFGGNSWWRGEPKPTARDRVEK